MLNSGINIIIHIWLCIILYTVIQPDMDAFLRSLTAEIISDIFKEDYIPLKQKAWTKLSR